MPNRKVILYIAMSLDGFIAAPNDDLSFLSVVQEEGEDYGYNKFICSIDTVIIGRKTYDWVMTQVPEFPHADKVTYVITRSPRPSIETTHFYTGSLPSLVAELKAMDSAKHIFCDGGAEVVNALLKENVIDEFIISIIPTLLGDGTQLFQNGDRLQQSLELVSIKQFTSGLVQIHYCRI
ncbi:MAG: dihydrofolate reductase [Ignavibacteria bacterium]|nr:dihydrofolate reductase [Ignavibacteria bacterium]